jgi:hypothetical protein
MLDFVQPAFAFRRRDAREDGLEELRARDRGDDRRWGKAKLGTGSVAIWRSAVSCRRIQDESVSPACGTGGRGVPCLGHAGCRFCRWHDTLRYRLQRADLECRFTGSLAHPVGAGYQFVAAHSEPAIDQEEVFSLPYNRIVALP